MWMKFLNFLKPFLLFAFVVVVVDVFNCICLAYCQVNKIFTIFILHSWSFKFRIWVHVFWSCSLKYQIPTLEDDSSAKNPQFHS